MVLLKPKSSSFGSLWSIVYCFIAVSVQCYIAYRNISGYQESLRNQWNRDTPPEVGVKLGLTIISFIVLPFFIMSSIFRTGNYGNDGFKLGRDHAICPVSGGVLDHIASDIGRRIWRYAPPFAPTLHVLSAFCLLFPDVLISAKEIQLHLQSTGIFSYNVSVWTQKKIYRLQNSYQFFLKLVFVNLIPRPWKYW